MEATNNTNKVEVLTHQDHNIFKNILFLFSATKEISLHSKNLLKVFKKKNKVFSLFKKIISIPGFFIKLAQIMLDEESTFVRKIFAISTKSASFFLNIAYWLGKIVYQLTTKTLTILMLVKSIISGITSVVDLIDLCLERIHEVRVDRRIKKELRISIAPLNSNLKENYETFKSERKHRKKKFHKALKENLHRLSLSALYIAAGILLLTPGTLPVAVFMFTALSIYESMSATLFDIKIAKKETTVKKEAKPIKKKLPMSFVMLASAVVATTLTLLTGPIGAMIFGMVLGILTLGMFIRRQRQLRKRFVLRINTEEEFTEPIVTRTVYVNAKNIRINDTLNKIKKEPTPIYTEPIVKYISKNPASFFKSRPIKNISHHLSKAKISPKREASSAC